MRLRFLFFFFIAIALIPQFSHAQSASQLQSQIQENNRQLEALKAEIAQYQKQLNALGTQKSTLQSAINELTLSQKQLSTQIKATENKIRSANLQIQELTLSIGDKETAIAEDQIAIAKALRTIAEGEEPPLVVQVISSDSLGEAWQKADELVQFNEALRDNIANLRMVRTELSTNRDKVTAAKKNLVALQNELGLQKKSIDVQKTAQQKLLSDTQSQESNYQKLLAQKKAEEAAFEKALFDLESQLQYILDPRSIPPAGKGVLRWPVANVFITQQFGKTSDSRRLYASGTHNGVDFRASIGTPIFAAGSGTVWATNLGAVPNCQYGKWVLVKHPNGLATLYAHLSDVRVQKGQAVTTGQVVGFAGNTGYAIGPHLHFTVYAAGAVTFKNYTCWNGAVVNIPIAPVNAYLDPMVYL
jgi:murein DD-endopeptidase MepM/ murein hydrolase activator NlpD